MEEIKITKANSPVITRKVIQTAKEAGGEEHGACVVYCLLVCHRWFKKQAMLELWDADLHNVRAVACEVLAKQMYVNLRYSDSLSFFPHPTPIGHYPLVFSQPF